MCPCNKWHDKNKLYTTTIKKMYRNAGSNRIPKQNQNHINLSFAFCCCYPRTTTMTTKADKNQLLTVDTSPHSCMQCLGDCLAVLVAFCWMVIESETNSLFTERNSHFLMVREREKEIEKKKTRTNAKIPKFFRWKNKKRCVVKMSNVI